MMLTDLTSEERSKLDCIVNQHEGTAMGEPLIRQNSREAEETLRRR
jgi:hypothetical protein